MKEGPRSLRPTLPPALDPGGAGGQCEGLRRPQGHTGQKGMRWGPWVSPAHPFLGSATDPDLNLGSLRALCSGRPSPGALRFSGDKTPQGLSRAGGERGRDSMGATGCRGLRLLDGVSLQRSRPAPTPFCPRRLQGRPPPGRVKPADAEGAGRKPRGQWGVQEPAGSHTGDPTTTTQGRAPSPTLDRRLLLRAGPPQPLESD